MRANCFTEMKVAEEYCWAITGGWSVLLRSFKFLCVRVWISARLPFVYISVKGRCSHEGPEGEWRYSPTLSLTSVLDGGGWSAPRPGRFTPGKDPVPIVQEAG